MSRERLADAFDKAADAMSQLAHELRGADSESGRVPSVPAPSQAAGRAPSPAPAADYDAAFCPKHGQPWSQGNYGPFCKSKSDEPPPWSNDRGYCRITPKNAPDWLRVQAAA